jgi:hypothetical protein
MTLRRIALLAAACCVLGALVPGQAVAKVAKKHARVALGSYTAPGIGVGGVGGGLHCGQSGSAGCVQFSTKASERFATISIKDDSGNPVYATWGQDINGDSQLDRGGEFCGKTKSPVTLVGGKDLVILIWEGSALDGSCDGFATQGSVTATFS